MTLGTGNGDLLSSSRSSIAPHHILKMAMPRLVEVGDVTSKFVLFDTTVDI